MFDTMANYKIQPRKTARYFPSQVSLVTAMVYDYFVEHIRLMLLNSICGLQYIQMVII